jgi:carboxyl-terminal processing protease
MHGGELDTIPDIVNCVQANHLLPASLDDKLSENLFWNFIEILDPDKMFFFEPDIVSLEKNKTSLDDALKSGLMEFKQVSVSSLKKRIEEAIAIIEKLPNVLVEENLCPDFETYATSTLEMKERWKIRITTKCIESYLALHGKTNLKEFPFDANLCLEKSKKRILNDLKVMLSRTDNEWTVLFVNAYLRLNDYQSAYLTTEEKQKWDESFTRKFVGIGIEYEIQGEYPIVKNISSGGPAFSSKKIEVGDILLAIADSNSVFIDIANKNSEDISELLNGEEGSPIKIKVLKSNKEEILVDLIRAAISLQRLSAYAVGNTSNSQSAALIHLPRFYEGDHLCSEDMANELRKIKELSITKLIIDLRDNQGGSAREAIKIMGYFLEGGVVMQAQYAEGKERVFSDPDSTALFTGELILLVNENSASASELFAGTMQDYGRALVVGSQTYGKGTIQRFFEVNHNNQPIGEVKLTIGNFYTASGRSIQYKGITPDLIIPSKWDSILTGERAFPPSLQTFDLENPKLERQFSSEPAISKDYQKEVNNQFSDIITISQLKKACTQMLNSAVDLTDYMVHCEHCSSIDLLHEQKTGLHFQQITSEDNKELEKSSDLPIQTYEKDRWLKVGYDILMKGN